ncbi:DUF2750 domain-containing protein [Pseudomaricurvus sp. HS19]|uniref:DUF2750 domain-containing protein n=1 Tax=Pseudomaricurvus sp. HS19 TaxID=2692626 RepID=UPI001371509A|nr:DUF2750 domain-containing protein [Pseudomaricurvus sp. HS19]MYM62277.1 DUF2750 domain-containing protein [Pseudomaricurvus sp. HS19]
MRYAPYETEVKELGVMSESQLLEYFLTRVFETEEVWGLEDDCEWATIQLAAHSAMPIWPYQQLANSAASNLPAANNLLPTAESLEDFMDHTLPSLIEEDVMLAVMTSEESTGCLVSPHRLLDIFTGMMESGTYSLDA